MGRSTWNVGVRFCVRSYDVFVFHVERVFDACLSFFPRACVWLNMGCVGLFLGWVLGLILDDGWIYIGRCVNLYRLIREAI